MSKRTTYNRHASYAYAVIKSGKFADVINVPEYLEPDPRQFLKARGIDVPSSPMQEETLKRNVRDLLAAIDALEPGNER